MTYPVKVLGFGDNVVDKYEHLKIMYPGGNAVNFAVYAKKFGAERSAYMGIFGNDEEGEHVIASLEAEGIELVKCIQVIGENGASKNTVIDGDRVFLESNEGGIRGDMRYVLSRFDLEYIKQFDLVHTGNYCFTERELPKIKKAGVPISFDFSDDSTKEYFEMVAPQVDFAFLSCSDMGEEEIREKLAWIHSLGPSFVCASRGSEGCIAYDGEQYYLQAAMPVEKMADTMGAGDSLLTSFLVGYLSAKKEGRTGSDVIADCLQKAAEFASEICGIDGAWGYGVQYDE
ncbi:MAG: PfkB family carbohydrate kinase [Anaerotignum sp.]